MPKPSNTNGTIKSFENILLKNQNAASHPELGNMLTSYVAALGSGYSPPEDVIGAILALNPTDPAAQTLVGQIAQQMQDLGLTLAITSGGGGDSTNVSVDENTTYVTTVEASDPQGDRVTYSITGGDDAALFSIDPDTGELLFIGGPDYENPGDSGGDNVYGVIVSATDTVSGQTDTQAISVTVNDVVEGPPIDNSFTLTSGNDTFWGAALNTRVDGLDGNDTIAGDAYQIYDGRGPSPVRQMGDDLLNGGGGADTIFGDANTIFSYRSWYANPRFEAGSDYINGGDGGDSLYGDSYRVTADFNNYGGFNVIGGNDVMSGDGGADYMVGDVHSVSITSRNGTWNVEGGDDVMSGGDGNDTIIGDMVSVYVSSYRGEGTAVIQNGDDRIIGGAGNDNMWGDSVHYNPRTATHITNGADTFVFADNSGNDTVNDFQTGLDSIEVAGYGLSDFSQLTISESGGNSTIHFDAFNSVVLVGVTGLTADDFAFV